MKTMEFEGRKRINTHLNIAPLIDVVFLLLIFFMLSSHFITQPGIKISLPEAATTKLHPEEDIIISIAEDNNLYLNEKQVTLKKKAVYQTHHLKTHGMSLQLRKYCKWLTSKATIK